MPRKSSPHVASEPVADVAVADKVVSAALIIANWADLHKGVQRNPSGNRAWCPHQRTTSSDQDRYDLVGTELINELVLKHCCGTKSEKGSGAWPARFTRVHTAAAAGTAPVFAIDKYCFQLIKNIVHPLHNYLQLYASHHNADEIQVMLMPRQGPIADAERAYRSRPSSASSRKRAREEPVPPSGQRHCYVATNKETLTKEALLSSVTGWGTPSVFQISGFTLIQGEVGRHAELKLLDFLAEKIIPLSALSACTFPPSAMATEEKALIVGERFPCVVCRVAAVSHESYAQLLPSHGHFYVSTALTEARCAAHSRCHGNKERNVRDQLDIARILSSPTSVYEMLTTKRGRVLRQ